MNLVIAEHRLVMSGSFSLDRLHSAGGLVGCMARQRPAVQALASICATGHVLQYVLCIACHTQAVASAALLLGWCAWSAAGGLCPVEHRYSMPFKAEL